MYTILIEELDEIIPAPISNLRGPAQNLYDMHGGSANRDLLIFWAEMYIGGFSFDDSKFIKSY